MKNALFLPFIMIFLFCGTSHADVITLDDKSPWVGYDGYFDSIFKDVTFKVYKTEELHVVKFSVKRFTRCHSIDIVEYDLGAALEVVIDDGPHKGENGWIDFWDFHED